MTGRELGIALPFPLLDDDEGEEEEDAPELLEGEWMDSYKELEAAISA